MRMMAFLLLLSVFQAAARNSYSQNVKVTINMDDVTVGEVLNTIEAQSDYYFIFNQKLVDVDRKVSVHAQNKKVSKILDELFAGTDIRHMVMDRQIILSPKELLAENVRKTQQKYVVSGTVSDEKGEPLPGVNIMEKGTTNGTISGTDGSYTLQVSSQDAVLVFSFVGYKTQEVPVAGKKVVNVSLQPEAIGLDEVVTIGYGTKKKIHSAGSISTVTSTEIVKTPVSNMKDAIVGRTSGIIAVTPSGSPGTGAQIQIRGMSTLQNNSVLVLVDGVQRPFSQLDPNEIESITILKDGASAAIYGVKGGNGVILVTTKRGKLGKPRFSFNSYTGIQQVTRYPDLLNSYQYAVTNNQAYENMGLDPNDPANAGKFFTADQLAKFKSGEINTQFKDLVFKNNPVKMHYNLNVNGGSDKIRYFFSGGYLAQDGLIPNSSFNRYNLRSNVDATINKYFTVSINLDGRLEDKDSPSWGEGNIFSHMVRAIPTERAYDKNGKPLDILSPQPLEEAKNGGVNNWKTSVLNAQMNAVLDLGFVKPLEGLKAKFMYSYDQNVVVNKKYKKPYKVYVPDQNGMATEEVKWKGGARQLTQSNLNSHRYTLDLSLDYDRTFGKHHISGLFVYEQRENFNTYLVASRQGFISDIIQELFAGDPETATNNGWASEGGYLSYIGRLSYVYANKYIFDVSAREDASVLFPPDTRWGFFPSFAVAWRLSEEHFIKDNLSFVNNLKLRASYGMLGTDAGAGNFAYLEQYKLTYGALIDNRITTGLVKYVEPNKDITWEKVASFDLGLEGLFWNGLLGFDMAYFKKNTSDILAPKIISTPQTFGANLPPVNYAEVELKGFEMSLTHTNTIGEVRYSLAGNFTYSKNKVLQIDDPEDQLPHLVRKGKPLDFYVGYKTDGLFQSDQEAQDYYPQFGNNLVGGGDIKYIDRNGDKVIDNKDLDVISLYSYMPRVMFGMDMKLSWRNFDFSALFQGAAGRKIMLSGPARVMFQIGGNNFYTYLLDCWSPDNKDAKYPRAWRGNNINNDKDSDFWLRDGSYLRLKNLEIGYNFKSLVPNVDNLRLYFAAYNVFTIDKIKYFDPEVASGSGRYDVNANAQHNYTTWGTYYPQLKSYNIGVNITF